MMAQDPYPFNDHADGLAFSSKQVETPPSLRLILRELDRDVLHTHTYEEYKKCVPHNNLESWARQGVFLINSCLTVRAGESNSHSHLGWQTFIAECLKQLIEDDSPKVFVLWGSEAQETFKEVGRDSIKHLVLTSGHPASALHGKDRFSGCNHFSKINQHFRKLNLPQIEWRIS